MEIKEKSYLSVCHGALLGYPVLHNPVIAYGEPDVERLLEIMP